MPFNNLGVYTPPTGATNAVPGQVIRSATWNTIFTDLAVAISQGQRTITAAGSATVVATDTNVLVNKTVGAANTIALPAAATMTSPVVVIKDFKGDAATNPITINPNGSETIDGVNGPIYINNAWQDAVLTPTTGGWFTRKQISPAIYTQNASAFNKTGDTTLANVTGLLANVIAGGLYNFEANLYTTSTITGGVKAAISGTASAGTIIAEALVTAPPGSIAVQNRVTAMGATLGSVTSVTVALIRITGSASIAASGTFGVYFAQNASIGTTASTVLAGSTFNIYKTN